MNTLTFADGGRALVLCAFGLLSFTALAAPKDEQVTTRSVKVPYGDLDVNSSEGAVELHKRLAAAARRACSSPGHLQTFELRKRQRDCQKVALASAVDSLRNERLSAVHKRAGRRTG